MVYGARIEGSCENSFPNSAFCCKEASGGKFKGKPVFGSIGALGSGIDSASGPSCHGVSDGLCHPGAYCGGAKRDAFHLDVPWMKLKVSAPNTVRRGFQCIMIRAV
jgi:hypothetical protein